MLISFPLLGYCQSADDSERKFSVGLSFSPDYCYRSIISDKSSVNDIICKNRDSIEIPKYGFTSGISLKYRLNKTISLESGVFYSEKGEKTKSIALKSDIDEGFAKLKLIYHYSYLDIPLKVNINLLTSKLKVYISAGLVANIFMSNKNISYVEYTDGSTKSFSNNYNNEYNRLALSFIAGLGLSYDISDKFTCKFEPSYKRFITSATNTPIKGYFYSSGLNVGIDYKF